MVKYGLTLQNILALVLKKLISIPVEGLIMSLSKWAKCEMLKSLMKGLDEGTDIDTTVFSVYRDGSQFPITPVFDICIQSVNFIQF